MTQAKLAPGRKVAIVAPDGTTLFQGTVLQIDSEHAAGRTTERITVESTGKRVPAAGHNAKARP